MEVGEQMANGIGGKRKLKFRTTQNKKNARRRIFVIIFIFIIIIVATISLVVLSREYNIFGDETENVNGKIDSIVPNQMKSSVTILFAGVPTSDDDISFLTYITMKTKEKRFEVVAISPTDTYKGVTFAEYYAPRGQADSASQTNVKDLIESVSRKYNTDIDKYVIVTEKNFKDFIYAIGLPEYDFPEKIEYNADGFSLNLLSGNQKLTGDKLFKYIVYTGMGNSDYALNKQGEVIAELLRQKLNEENSERGEELFGRLANLSSTDIKIVDYAKYKEFLSEISANPKDIEVKRPNISESD